MNVAKTGLHRHFKCGAMLCQTHVGYMCKRHVSDTILLSIYFSNVVACQCVVHARVGMSVFMQHRAKAMVPTNFFAMSSLMEQFFMV